MISSICMCCVDWLLILSEWGHGIYHSAFDSLRHHWLSCFYSLRKKSKCWPFDFLFSKNANTVNSFVFDSLRMRTLCILFCFYFLRMRRHWRPVWRTIKENCRRLRSGSSNWRKWQRRSSKRECPQCKGRLLPLTPLVLTRKN